MIHEILVLPYYFGMFLSGMINFEITIDNRDFKAGDNVVLKEFSFRNNQGEYVETRLTGREMFVKIKAVLRNCIGVENGYIILIFEKYEYE